MEKVLIHERGASVRIYEIGEDSVLLEGVLMDERFCKSYVYSTRQKREPGMMHRIIVRLVLLLPEMTILSAEAEMPAVVADECRDVQDMVGKLTGLKLSRGFRKKLNELLGGKNGCVHMNNLLLFMSTAAVQGSYSYYNRIREGGRMKSPDFDASLLINSCHLWRDDGVFARRIDKVWKSAKKD